MLFKDMTDDELRFAYRAERTTMYNWSQMAGGNPRSRDGRKIASGVGRSLRNVEIMEAIARRRRIRLTG